MTRDVVERCAVARTPSTKAGAPVGRPPTSQAPAQRLTLCTVAVITQELARFWRSHVVWTCAGDMGTLSQL